MKRRFSRFTSRVLGRQYVAEDDSELGTTLPLFPKWRLLACATTPILKDLSGNDFLVYKMDIILTPTSGLLN